MADNDWTVVSESPATDAGASEWEIASEVPTGPQAPGPTPGLVSFINEPKKAEQPKIGSVFDTIPFEPEFNPQEAERLSRRAYAEESARPAVAPGTMKPSPAKNTLSDIATGLASGLKTDLDKAYSTGVRGIGNWIATESIGNKELGETGKALEEIGAKGYRKAAKEEARAQPTFESSTAAGLYSGARSLEQMLAAFAASGGNPTGTLAILSGASGMQGAGEALEKGKPWDTAAAYGTAQAGLEFLTEKMPMGYVASKLGKEGFMRFMGGFLLREMPSEQIATITQDALEQAVLHPEKTWMDYVKDRPEAAYQTLLATAVMTGGMGGISGGQKYMVDRADAARAEAAKQAAISKWEQGFGKKPVTIEDVAKTAATEAPKVPAAADWEVVSEEPSAVTFAATPAVQRMQEQQRAAEELEAVAPEPATGEIVQNASIGPAHEDYQREITEPALQAIQEGNSTPVKLKDGTEIDLVVSRNDENTEGRVIAFNKKGEEVGQVMFTKVEDEEGNRFNPNVYVDEGLRRKGLATAMYDLAEQSGAKIPSIEQRGQIRTEEGDAFREARTRAQMDKAFPPFVAAEEMEGLQAPREQEVQAELDRKIADQEAAIAERERLSKRTAGTSLMQVLKGSLNDGELSELGGRARQVGKNPFLNLKASKGQIGSSMEDMVESGALDAFLPENMKPGHPDYENSESAEFIRDKLRNGQYYTQETAQAIEMVDRDIEAIERQIADLLSEDEINKEIQYAVNEQRELDQAAAEPAPEEATGAAEERAAEEEVLKAQTEQELRDKQAEIDRLEKENARLEKEAKAKAEAPKAEEFVLTGSERAADQAAARGQMELAPSEEPAAKERSTEEIREEMIPLRDEKTSLYSKIGKSPAPGTPKRARFDEVNDKLRELIAEYDAAERRERGQTMLSIDPIGQSALGDNSSRSPSLKRKVKDLNRQREQGKISDERFVNEVDWAVKQDEEQRSKQMPRERVRGADFIRQKLLEAKRRGDLSAEAVDLAEWFILQNEALVDELGIAIKTPKEGGTGGTYNALARIMTLMKEAGNNETVVHEILHHLERMMPAEVQDAIRKEWMSRLLKAQKNAKSPQEKLFFAALMNHHLGSGKVVDIDAPGAGKMMEDLIKRGMIDGPRANSYQLAIDMLRNGILPVSNYQYATPSEFWAVNGSEIVRGRHNAVKGGVLARLKNWLKEQGQKIKSLFGMHSDAPLLRALDSLAKGDGKFVSKDMLYQGENFLQVGKNIYGRTPMVAWTKPDETKLDDFIYKMQDKHIDTKRVIQGIEESIGRIDDKWNPYLQEELFHGRTATETKEFLSGEVRPLLEQMQKEGVTIADLEEYLHNRFAPVRNENIAKINPLMPDGGSGIDTADAKAYMAALTPEQKAKYEKLAARVDAITDGTRQYLVASGLESADTIKEWEESSPDYVPLNREDVEYSTSIGTGTGLGYSVRGPSSRRATGSERKVVDILANTIMQRERALVRGEKNRVATALYGLAMQNPNPEYWLAVNPDAAQSKKKVTQELVDMGLTPTDAEGIMKEPTQKVVDPQTGMVTTRINPVLRSADNVLGVRINGKDRFIFFNTQDERGLRMAKALKNLDADQLGQIMTKMAAITRYFASINTQYNPVFGLYNFLRDLQGGAIQLSGTPIEDMRSEVLSPKNLVGALRGIYQTLRATRAGTQQTMTPWADLWTEFQREGGQTGYRDMFSRSQERANALQKELDRLNESKGKKTALAVPRAIFDWLADYNETLENAVRLTAYKSALDKGLSKEQAASVAKNLTVNFNRKGQTAVQAGALYAFFNSSVQGTSRLLQTIVKMDRPGDIKSLHLTKAGKVIIYGGLLAGSIQAMLLAAMGFDDEEPPDFVKDRNLIIPMPGGKYLAWPLPLGYHVIPAFSRILTEWAIAGGKDPGKRVAHLTSLLLDAFSPIGNAGLSVQSIAPTIFDPIVALAENKDWTGKKIAKEDFNKLDPTPGYTRAKQNASWIGKQLSYYLNLASGGDKDKPGVVSPTPDQIDYLIGQATGGVGREVMKATKTAEALRSGEELAPYNIPIVGRFYGDTKAGYAESARFYKNLEEINILENQLRGRQKRREGSSSEFISENPKVRLAQAAHETERNIQKLRKHRDKLIEKDAPRDQVKAIENRMTAQMKRLNEKAQKLEK